MEKNLSRANSFAIIGIVYVAAILLGYLVYKGAEALWLAELWCLFIADAVATIFVWIIGLAYQNVSVYDPYWSVAPPVMLTIWVCTNGSVDLPTILMLIAVWVWGIRLTANWAITFKGLAHEDWRYTKYRTELPKPLFHIVNFFGLNMVPTIVVFLAMVPAFGMIDASCKASAFTWVAFLMCLACPIIQYIADTQSHRFRREHPGEVCDQGLWKKGRHPNYFGEVMMWWSIWLLYITSVPAITVWCVAGAIANLALFLFISIPLMEIRQLANKPGYAEYRRRTRLFI